jgi:3-oxoacyl-[acyl-carrier protein] reductase
MKPSKTENPLAGKWALVTGASRGIGREIASALAKEGCNLLLHSRSLVHTHALASALSLLGVTVRSLAASLENEEAVRQLAADALEQSGGVDILYNNAAVMTPYHSEWLDVVPNEFELSFRVNTIAPILLCNLLLPSMMTAGWGRIVNVTSGIKDQPELMAYAASKAALDKYVIDMAAKLTGTGVIMNLLDPGWLRTDLGGPQAPGAVESVIPGALVPVLADDGLSGLLFRAQEYVEG